jgi:hypothetical protein
MPRRYHIAIATLLLAAACQAQTSLLQQLDPLSASSNGIHLYGVSVSEGYFSGNYAPGFGMSLLSGSSGQNLVSMVTTSLGWSRASQNSSISVVYAPSYVRGLYFQDFHTTNHTLAIDASRSVGAKWRMGLSVSAILSDFNELLFAPTAYGNIASTSATFDELAGAVLTGTTTNQALGVAASAAQAVSAPQSAFLYGGREFSSAAILALTYQRSQRSTLRVSLGGVRTQTMAQAGTTSRGYYVPQTTSGSVSIGWSYALNTRTNFGVSVAEGRIFSTYLSDYSTQANVSFGHTMSRRWFVQGSGGIGYITPVYQRVTLPRNIQYLFNGGVGFKTFTQTFLGSYSRTVADSYGIGASATDSSSASWVWRKPGSSISLYGVFGYMRFLGPAYLNGGSWTESAGIARALGDHLSISASYSHVSLPATLALAATNLSQSGAIVSLSWSPSARRHGAGTQ